MYVVLGELVDLGVEAKRLQKDLESGKEGTLAEPYPANEGFVAKARLKLSRRNVHLRRALRLLSEQQIADSLIVKL